jgi:hypothetical protein
MSADGGEWSPTVGRLVERERLTVHAEHRCAGLPGGFSANVKVTAIAGKRSAARRVIHDGSSRSAGACLPQR